MFFVNCFLFNLDFSQLKPFFMRLQRFFFFCFFFCRLLLVNINTFSLLFVCKTQKIELFKRKTWCRSRQTDMHTYREYTKATNCIQSSIEFMSTTSQKETIAHISTSSISQITRTRWWWWWCEDDHYAEKYTTYTFIVKYIVFACFSFIR